MSKTIEDKLSRKVKRIQPSGIRCIAEAAKEYADIISLSIGEPDFDTPAAIRDTGIRALQSGKSFYTENAGLLELRKAICEDIFQRTGIQYDAQKEILITVGGSEAIDLALRALLNPGDEVIYPDPGFVSYLPCIALSGGVPVPIRLTAETKFRLRRAQLEAAVTPKTKVLILSYPHNPTGAVMQKKDLEELLPVILEKDLLVISDEIYSELIYEDRFCSCSSLPNMATRTIVIRGFSKSFAMTGWRLGYVLAPREITAQMVKIHQYTAMCAPTVSQYAAIEAIRHGAAETEAMRRDYDARRNFLCDALHSLQLPFISRKAHFTYSPIFGSLVCPVRNLHKDF